MMQLRCESAVTQGLRSDVLQATKMPESAGLHPEPPFPLALWLWTSPYSGPALLPVTLKVPHTTFLNVVTIGNNVTKSILFSKLC